MTGGTRTVSSLDDLLEILACPDCKTPVFLDQVDGAEFIQCTEPSCRRRYEIRESIPVMLIDESTVLSEEDFQAALSRRPADSTPSA